MKILQEMFGCHCIGKFKGFVFSFGLSGKLWILMGVLLPYLDITQIHVFPIGQETKAVQKFKLINRTNLKLQKGHEAVFRLF